MSSYQQNHGHASTVFKVPLESNQVSCTQVALVGSPDGFDCRDAVTCSGVSASARPRAARRLTAASATSR